MLSFGRPLPFSDRGFTTFDLVVCRVHIACLNSELYHVKKAPFSANYRICDSISHDVAFLLCIL
jgi:hypothetical protein